MAQRLLTEFVAGVLTVATPILSADGECSPAVLTYLPEDDAFTLHQFDDPDRPDVVMLTREMVEQLVSLSRPGIMSASQGLKHVN